MRLRIRAVAAATVAAVLVGTGGCTEDTASEGTKDANPSATEDTTAPGKDPADEPATETAELPDLTGKGLQVAQDAAQAAGFHVLTSHDSAGRDRKQAFDRNWKVCFQTPAAGEHPTDIEVDFGTVKLEEDCPAQDVKDSAPEATEGTMPDVVGESANVARDALPDNASITVNDVSGEDRAVLMESNWQVCSQEPAAGAPFAGEPVTLSVVKFEESCP
ncbi:PASTA domain-containing protein [Streptomyces sp. JJ38]|uniref:PASTA domain-containing protein n=1 Tax=Streptomyces sp. JJ38 TaxID=2738128 RepID=UPI001C571EF3|nr:PASTA domain-containing protein [Streptomyces sp. JJ38]MBW1598250.1 hypothetical protein [Streptomyces sp. JJ38]